MYLFQRLANAGCLIHYPRFTFHYVSISTWSSGMDGLIRQIYIPLCIYFNGRWICCYPTCNKIYIPLCIYFNRQHRILRTKHRQIYIPLCIYFNASAVMSWHRYYQFTFHYVSISTHSRTFTKWADAYLHSTMYLFQPAAILFRSVIWLNLHSTMYLFQLA